MAGLIKNRSEGLPLQVSPARALPVGVLERLTFRQSTGRVGSTLDSAVIESWHSTLEFELRSLDYFITKVQARARIAAWIDEYNRDRRHSACQMRSPIQQELEMRRQAGSAA